MFLFRCKSDFRGVTDWYQEPRIMPLRRLKKKSIKRLVEKCVAKAIEEYEKTRANLDNAGSSEGNSENVGGTVNVQGCSHKTFMIGKPHPLNRTKGVVGLRRWIKKKKIERYIQGFTEEIKGNITSSRPTTLHDAINMARELVEQAVQGRAVKISESNKRKWEDQQGNNHHQQQNQRQEAAKAYVAAPAKGRGYAGNLPWCNRCKAHHLPSLYPPRCSNCHNLGHEEEDRRTRIQVARGNSLQNVTCFGCEEKGHYRDKCPRGRNPQNESACGRAYVMITEEPQQDPNVILGTS
uniref:CCHC-type domain-containing protein n=1 Tax=Tanacetum cinerariifolium TaxID=118510 RepID=A0A699GTC8_TANCI|nr:hypothetical protein [Tanacetum cinerariifolium]